MKMIADLTKKALFHLRNKNYHKALEIWDEAANKGIDPQTIALKKADIFFALRDYEKMHKELYAALNKGGQNSNLLLKLVHLYYEQNKLEDALTICQKIYLLEDHNLPNSLISSGYILEKLNKPMEAINCFSLYLNRVPNNNNIHLKLIELYYENNLLKPLLEKVNSLKNLNLNEENLTFLISLAITCSTKKIDLLSPVNSLIAEYLSKNQPKDKDFIKRLLYYALKTVNIDLASSIDKKAALKHLIETNQNTLFLLFKGTVSTHEDRLNLLEAHRTWGQNLENNTNPLLINRPIKKKLNNKVRIGFISADFINNHIGYYIWPLISNLDQSQFEIYCYSQRYFSSIGLNAKFRSLSHSFIDVQGKDPQEIAQIIANDNLDILVEMSLWIRNTQILAYKPAPLQISWLDYLHSVGLPTSIDYLTLDPYVKPPSPNMIIEKPLILPETWIVMDEVGFPAVEIDEVTAEEKNGFITFGVINAPNRLNADNIRTWANIMRQVPNSRLIYLNLYSYCQILRDNFCKHMAQNGIDPSRISFISESQNFLPYFNKIDIALDTFPYMGATTTCYTLWMGVPLVTLIGQCFFERVSYSALMNCELEELCASTVEQYQEIALILANDRQKRKQIRNTLRSRILNGPLGQPKRFATNMGNAILKALGKIPT